MVKKGEVPLMFGSSTRIRQPTPVCIQLVRADPRHSTVLGALTSCFAGMFVGNSSRFQCDNVLGVRVHVAAAYSCPEPSYHEHFVVLIIVQFFLHQCVFSPR